MNLGTKAKQRLGLAVIMCHVCQGIANCKVDDCKEVMRKSLEGVQGGEGRILPELRWEVSSGLRLRH